MSAQEGLENLLVDLGFGDAYDLSHAIVDSGWFTEVKTQTLIDAMPTVNHSVQSEAQVLVDAAWKLRNDYPAGGSNVRAAIATLLDRVAAAHDPAVTTKYAGHLSRDEQIDARRAESTNDQEGQS